MTDECFLHHGTDIHINLIDAVANRTNLKTIGNVRIPTDCIAIIPTKLTA